MASPKNHAAALVQVREEALLVLALTKPVLERVALLDRECAGEPVLRARLDAKLAAHDAEDKSSQGPEGQKDTMPHSTSKVIDLHSQVEALGTIIGRYRLLERIGEGGMGVVYMAEQSEPVRRRVALKL